MTRPAYHHRCLCGLRLKMHMHEGRMLSCERAADMHRYARIKFRPLRELMLRSLSGHDGDAEPKRRAS